MSSAVDRRHRFADEERRQRVAAWRRTGLRESEFARPAGTAQAYVSILSVYLTGIPIPRTRRICQRLPFVRCGGAARSASAQGGEDASSTRSRHPLIRRRMRVGAESQLDSSPCCGHYDGAHRRPRRFTPSADRGRVHPRCRRFSRRRLTSPRRRPPPGLDDGPGIRDARHAVPAARPARILVLR